MGSMPRFAFVAVAIVLVAGLSLGFASTGVVKEDVDRNISIPDDLVMDLDMKVAYDDDEIFWRFRWDSELAI